MKVLDLFCGLGGWSIPFVEDGDFVVGIDIVNFKEYPGKLIVQDIRTIDGRKFKDFDLIIGSPPCNEFSIAKEIWKGTKNERNVEKGLELIYAFERIIAEAKPKIWIMENVKYLYDKKWYKKEPICFFRISKKGYRCLWSNIKFKIPEELYPDTDIWRRYGWKTRPYRAKIPYSIANYVKNIIKERIAKPIKVKEE